MKIRAKPYHLGVMREFTCSDCGIGVRRAADHPRANDRRCFLCIAPAGKIEIERAE